MIARHLASFSALVTMAYLCVATSPAPIKPRPSAHLSIPFSDGQTEAWVRVRWTGTELAFVSDSGQAFAVTLSTSAEPLSTCSVFESTTSEGFCFTDPRGADTEFLVRIELLGTSPATTFDLTVYVGGQVERTGYAWFGETDQYAYGVTLELL